MKQFLSARPEHLWQIGSTMTSLYRFDTVIHAWPGDADLAPGADLIVGDTQVATLAVDPTSLATPLGCTFEEAGAQLEKFERCFFEPDGYYVWRGKGWQLDGVIYDRADSLQYVEARGSCPEKEFNQLLAAISGPGQRFLFQLPRTAAYLDEENFRRFASAPRSD